MSISTSALVVLYYAYPASVFLYYVIASFYAGSAKRGKKDVAKIGGPRWATAILLAGFVSLHMAQLILLFVDCVVHDSWELNDYGIISHLSSAFIFGTQLRHLLSNITVSWPPLYGSWIMALFFEVTLGLMDLITSLDFPGFHSSTLALTVARCALICLTLLSAVYVTSRAAASGLASGADEESQSLLNHATSGPQQDSNGTQTAYGSIPASNPKPQPNHESPYRKRRRLAEEAMQERLNASESWVQYAKEFTIFLPYIWPSGMRALQIRALAVILCLLASNFLNVLIPRQTGLIMDILGGTRVASPWSAILFFIFLRLASSECGVNLLQSWLWVPVKFYSNEAITRVAFSHIMHLSADFHDAKNVPDLLMAVNGGSAVSNVAESVFLQAAPRIIDLGVAIVYLSVTFGSYEGFTTLVTGATFLTLARTLIKRSGDASRDRVGATYHEFSLRTGAFQGWNTACSFNQLGYEDNRHSDAVAVRWSKEKSYTMVLNLSVALQSLVLTMGLAASAFLAVIRIRQGQATPGQFAMLLMYWAQLSAPLQFFARLGSRINADFIEAERLLRILQTEPTVTNKKGARPLKFESGQVEFSDICFSYDESKKVINKISLNVDPGQTIAFVGSTGAGKSTLLKLLDRLYDVTEGSIQIDGQDIRDVDVFSLRERIGVVSQNPIMFNDSIMNNVRYAKLTATDEEVFEACRAACIHDDIKEFSNGYDTHVGTNGVKLSGGELQRVAIARAILRKPDIVLLDEATSAVDTDTEQKIQASLRTLCDSRTTFVVAHRLSTIMNADLIVVIEKGQIVEKGSHDELIQQGGRYADLWSKQYFIKSPKAKDAAKESSGPAIQGNDDSEAAVTKAETQGSSQGSQDNKSSDKDKS